MALDQMAGEIGCTRTACAGDPVAIGHEQAIRHHGLIWKLVDKVLVVVPANASRPALHQTGAGQDKAACAKADQLNARLGGGAKITLCGFIDLTARMQEPADHDHIVKLFRVEEVGGGRGQDAAACL